MVSENGFGKRSEVEDYRITNRGGKGVKTINITEKTGNLITLKNVTDLDDLMIINRSGITIRIGVDTLRVMGRATQGVKIIRLRDDEKIDKLGSIQWPCNEDHKEGTPTMHVDEFVRGKGKFFITEYIPTSERVNNKFPLILTTGRILAHYNVGAQTRRTNNVEWHDEDLIEIHPHDAEDRGINEQDWVGINSRAGDTVLRAKITDRVQPGVVYTTFHHPVSGANVITTDNSDWATNSPEFKVTAVQVTKVTQPSELQEKYQEFSEKQIKFAKKNEAQVD